MANLFNPSPSAFNASLPNLLSLEEAQNIRLQRLIQQRKRMEHMVQLIEQQKETIDILKQENSSINQQFYQLKLQNQLLTDKLTVASSHCQDLTEVLVKQISLVENLKGCLFGELKMNEYQLNMLDQEIQNSLSLYHAITAGKTSLHMNNYKEKISHLTQENLLLNQKYQSLCDDYCEVNKALKVKQYELLKYQNSQNPQTANSNDHLNGQQSASKRKSHQHGSIDKKEVKSQFSQIMQSKDNEINRLKQIIHSLRIQNSQKDILIQEHKTNEKEQKKLLRHLKTKFNEEGKQLSQIIKSKQVIQVIPQPKTQMVYEIEKLTKVSKRKPQIMQLQPTHNVVETKVFEEQNLNLNPSSCRKNSSNFKIQSKVQSDNVKVNINNSGLKKTVSKCVLQN